MASSPLSAATRRPSSMPPTSTTPGYGGDPRRGTRTMVWTTDPRELRRLTSKRSDTASVPTEVGVTCLARPPRDRCDLPEPPFPVLEAGGRSLVEGPGEAGREHQSDPSEYEERGRPRLPPRPLPARNAER